MDPPTAQVDEKQHGVCHEPTQGPDLGGEEVGRDQHVHVRADTRLPRGRRLALWSRGDAMALQDVADGLVADSIPKIGQGADDPVVAPGAIFLRHTDD